MALIPCPECKREISDRAPACPHCGLALSPAGAGVGAGAWPPASGAAPEEVAWEGAPSARLLAREIPGMAWALCAAPVLIALLPSALKLVAGQGRELRRLVAQQGETLRWLVIGVVVLAALGRLAAVGLRYARLRTTYYRLTNQRLTVESGLLSKRIDDVDLRSVEDVAFEQSALERLLGVGRLSIVSSDRSRPRLQLLGIRSAREVRERLRAAAYQASQRQIFTRAT